MAEPVLTDIVGGTWPRGVGFMHGLKMLARCGSEILLEAGLQRRRTWGAQLDLLGSCMGQWEPWLGTVCTVGGLQAGAHWTLGTLGRQRPLLPAQRLALPPGSQSLSFRGDSSVLPEEAP